MISSRPFIAKAAVAALVLAAAGTASVAQARGSVSVSIGAAVAPGVFVGATNAPYYYGGPRFAAVAPAYYAPAPVYYEPAPVYYEPAPAYYGYGYSPAPVVGVRYIWSPAHRRYYYMQGGHRHWR
jgi:hypothetical protein